MRKTLKRVLACGLSVTFFASSLTVVPLSTKVVKANAATDTVSSEVSGNTVTLGKGSYSTVTKGKQVYSEQAGLVDRTTEQAWWPKRSVEGNVYVTDNMKGAIPTNDWATSFLWGSMYGGVSNPFSEPAYAFPLAYQASKEGMYLTQPPVHTVTQSSGAMDYAMPLQTGYIDLAIKPSAFTPTDAKVDKVTDWSYDVVMENGDKKMKTTMTQGSPYAFFECENTDLEINFKRGTRMYLVEEKDNVLVLKVLDNKENDYNYYAFYGPEGVKWDLSGNPTHTINRVGVDLPEDRQYMSVAVLPEESKECMELFEKYAYNFIVNTEVEWYYRESDAEQVTFYYVDTEQKPESKQVGTIMGILPHQYKHSTLASYAYEDYGYDTVRGRMKLFASDGVYKTVMDFTGILPFMPDIPDGDQQQLAAYLDDFMNRSGAKNNPYMYIYEGEGDTYWTGKALNNVVNALAVAEELGDQAKADALLDSLKAELEDWFSTNDQEQDRYFYYDKEVGTLVGYPSNFGSDTQLNDHHFHYGYYIYAAAQVALRDPEWAKDKNWGGMIQELIYDIACPDRGGERYPFLRNFSPYEGHSWASGHQLFTDGNNQESSSEALNAWAGIILYGMATNNTQLRDLGIYLYTTEVSAVENYWFDVDKDVLSPKFRYRDESATKYDPNREEIQTQASMIWGGKYVYGTWWTAEPLQVQGINLLPMTGASLYLAKNKDYIEDNYTSARKLEERYTGPDKLANPYDRWNDIWNEYLALANPDKALANWSTTADEEGGESRAHTFHYMKSLQKYGTPDFSVKSTGILAMAFNKNGKRNYSAYNTGDKPWTVKFSDGGSIVVAPHTLYTGADGTTNYDPSYCSGAPIVTTEAPVVTTVPPIVTTQPPVVTTVPPIVTTKPPVVTTVPPIITTQPPVVTTVPPIVTTQPPVVTTVPPIITTVSPAVTTTIPVITGVAPPTYIAPSPAHTFVPAIGEEKKRVWFGADQGVVSKIGSELKIRFHYDNAWAMGAYQINHDGIDRQISLHRENDEWVGLIDDAFNGNVISLYVTFMNAGQVFGADSILATRPIDFKIVSDGLEATGEKIENWPVFVTESLYPSVKNSVGYPIRFAMPDDQYNANGNYFDGMAMIPEDCQSLGNMGMFYNTGYQFSKGMVVLNRNVAWASACITVDGGKTFQYMSMTPVRGAWCVPVNNLGNDPVGISFVFKDQAGLVWYYGPYFIEWKEHMVAKSTGYEFTPATYVDYQQGYLITQLKKALEAIVPISAPTEVTTSEPPVTTVPPTTVPPTTVPPTGEPEIITKVECKETTNISSNINITYEITSTGPESIPISDLVLKHSFKHIDSSIPQHFVCNHAGLQSAEAPYYTDLTKDVTGEFRDGALYIRINNDSKLKTLPGDSLKISIMLYQNNWVSYQNDVTENQFVIMNHNMIIYVKDRD